MVKFISNYNGPCPITSFRYKELHLIYRAQVECEDFGSENGTFNRGFDLNCVFLVSCHCTCMIYFIDMQQGYGGAPPGKTYFVFPSLMTVSLSCSSFNYSKYKE